MLICLWLYYEGLNNCIFNSNISHCFNSQNIETVWSITKTAVLKAMSSNIPNFKLQPHQYPKWFSPELQHKLKCLHAIKKQYKLSPISHNLDPLNHAKAQFQLDIDSTKSNYEANLIHSLPITIILKFTVIYRVLQRPKIFPLYFILIHPLLQLMLIKLCFTTNFFIRVHK